jgi:hypothetical protein
VAAVIISLNVDGQDASWTASRVAGSGAVSGSKVGADWGELAVSGRRRLVAARQANDERRKKSVHKKSLNVERVNMSE